MLHEETVEAGTMALIRKLSADDRLRDFVLVGGTALSLQLGHRKSIDIDLFAARPFDPKSIAGHIESVFKGKDIAVVGNTLFSYINGIKTDMLAHGYEWIRPVQETDGVRMASLEDIAAMKLHAIVNSGKRLKDYVDIHYLLELRNLNELTATYTAKYPDSNPASARNALLYHAEIDFKVELGLLNREFKWEEVKARLKEAVVEPKKVFEVKQAPSTKIQKTREDDPSQRLGKGRRR
jgi:hypothetical protein